MSNINMTVLLLLLSCIESLQLQDNPPLKSPIFQFGDSMSDTGNALAAFPEVAHPLSEPPYGMTFFHHPAGRSSDGRLVIDFLAAGLGVPFLNPSLRSGDANGPNYLNGANFAICAAPALDMEFYKEHKMDLGHAVNTSALNTQVEWFLKFQKDAALRHEEGRFPNPFQFSRALYVVGEIGGDDYQLMLQNGWSFSQMHDMVPHVVRSIEKHIVDLYDAGARRFLVVNIPPQGCAPAHLATAKPDGYDQLGCVEAFNNVNVHHNALLKDAVQRLRKELAHSSISYADFYGISIKVLREHQAYGIPDPHIACCGIFTNVTTLYCADSKVIDGVVVTAEACSSPSEFMYWDDGHFTDHVNNIVADAFLSGEYVDEPINLDAATSKDTNHRTLLCKRAAM